MLIIETKTIDGTEFTYTRSDLGVYILNENNEKYADAYDLKTRPHTYTETDELIDVPEEWDDTKKKDWLDFLKEYSFFFGDQEYIYSKYKIVKECMSRDIWEKIKKSMSEEMKDLFDAAIEFSSSDDFFIKGVYQFYCTFGMSMKDIREMLDTCLK